MRVAVRPRGVSPPAQRWSLVRHHEGDVELGGRRRGLVRATARRRGRAGGAAAGPWDWDAEGRGKLECQCAASGTRVPREERHAKVLSADRVAAARQRQAE